MSRTADHIDLHVAARIKEGRRRSSCSQIQLADRLGITFQQVQKYEAGTNRISASTLYRIASRLHQPIEWFFEGVKIK